MFALRSALLALWLAALACKGPNTPATRGVESRADATTPVTLRDSLTFSLETPARATRGTPVPFVLRLVNVSSRRLTLYLRGREISFDLRVTGLGGALQWQRLAGRSIPAIIQVRELKPREVIRLTDVWDQRTATGDPVQPGEYQVQGLLLTDGEPLRTAPVQFRVDAGGKREQ